MSTAPDVGAIRELVTVRDWLRYAVSRFRAAGLAFGHGTSDAIDEAAYLILHTLNLPIGDINPWIDARLLEIERKAVAEIIERRIQSRKPASYLTREAWIGDHAFFVDERVIVPRSYIGELLVGDGLSAIVADASRVESVLDLCTGSGCLAILAALAFPTALVDAADISRDALDVAAVNVANYGLGDRLSLVQSDVFAALAGRRYDVVIANPPYVTTAAVDAFPPEWRAEPRLAHEAGSDGLDIVRRILGEARSHLTDHGVLVVEVGQGRAGLEAAYPDLEALWLDTAESSGEVFAATAEALDRLEAGKRGVGRAPAIRRPRGASASRRSRR